MPAFGTNGLTRSVFIVWAAFGERSLGKSEVKLIISFGNVDSNLLHNLYLLCWSLFVHNLYRNCVERLHTLDKFHCSKSWNTFFNKLLSEWNQISAREEFRGMVPLDLLEIESAANVCAYFWGRLEVWFPGNVVLCLSEAFANTLFPDWIYSSSVHLNCFQS